MKYHLVYEQGCDQVAREVRRLIADGWEPLGGVSCAMGGYFAQAMALYPHYAPTDKGREMVKEGR